MTRGLPSGNALVPAPNPTSRALGRVSTAALALASAAGLALAPVAAPGQEPASDGRVPGETWMRYATPEEAGWSSAAIADVKAYADWVGTAVGMLIHDGAVVTSWGDVTHLASISSMRKSLQVLVTGNYVESGDIDLDATLGELVVEDDPPLKPCEMDARVRHLLAMKSSVFHAAA